MQHTNDQISEPEPANPIKFGKITKERIKRFKKAFKSKWLEDKIKKHRK